MAPVATYATDGNEGTISTAMSNTVYVSYNKDKELNWFRVVPHSDLTYWTGDPAR